MSHPDLPIPMSMATTTSGHGTGIPDNGGSAPLRVLFTIRPHAWVAVPARQILDQARWVVSGERSVAPFRRL